MKNIFLVFILLIFASLSVAQDSQKDEWIRVQSDNGEFSIEVPSKFNYIFDKDGFQVSNSGATNYQLEKVNILNAFSNHTLVSFEMYEAKEVALDAIYARELSTVESHKKNKTSDFTETKVKPNKIRQLAIVEKNSYTVRRYFNSKNFIYILTTVTRKDENETSKHFWDSIIFNPTSKQSNPANGKLISTLPISPINLVTKNVVPDIAQTTKTPDESGVLPFAIGWKPTPAYIDNARMKAVQGSMRLRCTFAKDGFIPKIEFISILPEGLARQVLFAVLRLKFLPKEKDGIPQNYERIIEYHFSLY